ncbi:hypothetical protein [Sphingomonas sp. R86520]|uniref:hypothetical protein n=1 Tax=Sphingomonas sp. R86520 TaxID=3093859 RepID=UPI0036D40E89
MTVTEAPRIPEGNASLVLHLDLDGTIAGFFRELSQWRGKAIRTCRCWKLAGQYR